MEKEKTIDYKKIDFKKYKLVTMKDAYGDNISVLVKKEEKKITPIFPYPND